MADAIFRKLSVFATHAGSTDIDDGNTACIAIKTRNGIAAAEAVCPPKRGIELFVAPAKEVNIEAPVLDSIDLIKRRHLRLHFIPRDDALLIQPFQN